MPIAQELASVAYDIDPADNRPMVDGGGETREEQKAALAVVGAAELAKAEARRNKD